MGTEERMGVHPVAPSDTDFNDDSVNNQGEAPMSSESHCFSSQPAIVFVLSIVSQLWVRTDAGSEGFNLTAWLWSRCVGFGALLSRWPYPCGRASAHGARVIDAAVPANWNPGWWRQSWPGGQGGSPCPRWPYTRPDVNALWPRYAPQQIPRAVTRLLRTMTAMRQRRAGPRDKSRGQETCPMA